MRDTRNDREGTAAHVGSQASGRLYRAVAAEVFRVDDRLSVVAADRLDTPVLIDTAAASVLRFCHAERPLAAHAEHAARLLGADKAAVLTCVDTLVGRGLLQPVSRPRAAARSGAETTIDALAIVTAGRPAALERSLHSYVQHLSERGGTPSILVFDASARAPDTERAQALVAQTREGTDRDVRLFGPLSRDAIRRRAIDHGISGHIVDLFLPLPGATRTGGGVRNHLLLATAGQTVVTVDDDTVGRVWSAIDREAGVALVGHVDPRETLFFETRAEAFAATGEVRADILADHGRLLGWSVERLVSEADSLHLESACPHFAPVLDGSRPAARVRATWAGIAGDSAVFCPYPNLFVGGTTREHLAAAPERLRLALSTREVVRSVRRFTVTDEPWLMTYCAGLDNTAMLPPFSPIAGNEDGLFGAMLRMIDPDAFVGQLPCGVLHDSHRASRHDPGVIRSATDIRLSDVVQWISMPWAAACLDASPERRLIGLGEHLRACGRLSARAWRSRLLRTVIDGRRRTLIAAETMLAGGFDYPPYWRAEVRRFQQAVLDTLQTPGCIVPAEFSAYPSVDAAMTALQAHLTAFGEALVAWPTLWRLARETNDQPGA